jgi:hypothetical protein
MAVKKISGLPLPRRMNNLMSYVGELERNRILQSSSSVYCLIQFSVHTDRHDEYLPISVFAGNASWTVWFSSIRF